MFEKGSKDKASKRKERITDDSDTSDAKAPRGQRVAAPSLFGVYSPIALCSPFAGLQNDPEMYAMTPRSVATYKNANAKYDEMLRMQPVRPPFTSLVRTPHVCSAGNDLALKVDACALWPRFGFTALPAWFSGAWPIFAVLYPADCAS